MNEKHTILATCNECGARLNVTSRANVKVIPCPSCSNPVTAILDSKPTPQVIPADGYQFDCPNCGTQLEVDRRQIGTVADCFVCEQEITIPRLSSGALLSGQGHPAEQAEVIVRSVALKLNLRRVLKKIGQYKPRHIENARNSFASEMSDGEIPLVFIDRSFFGNGKAGLLLTNYRLYSSNTKSIALENIMAVAVEEQSLLVNGRVVFRGGFNQPFWIEALNRLAKAWRASPALPGSTRDANHRLQNEDDLARLIAAAICAGKTRAAIIDDFGRDGASRTRVAEIVDAMIPLRDKPRRVLDLSLILIGATSVVVGIVLTLATNSRVIFYGAVFVGSIEMCTGGYRLLFGRPPKNTQELRRAWAKNKDRIS